MFILDININWTQIDSIEILRIRNTKSGNNTYKIIKPKGFEKKTFKHHYDEGYLPLLIKALVILEANGYKGKPKYTWKELRKLIKEKELGEKI